MLRNRIWLSSRTDFNDPFDTRFAIDFPDSPDVVVKFIQGISVRHGSRGDPSPFIERLHSDPQSAHADIRKSTDSSLDSFGIYSMTQNVWHPLMWAHYADSHRGLALIFRHGAAVNWGAFPLRYEDEYPRAMLDEDGIPMYHAFVKGRDWAYEDEWRIVSHTAAHSYLELPHDRFAGVVFGANAKQETYDFILDMIKQRAAAKLPPVAVYRAEASESFKLNFYMFVGTNDWKPIQFGSTSPNPDTDTSN